MGTTKSLIRRLKPNYMRLQLLLACIAALVLSGCQTIAPYDQGSYDEGLADLKSVLAFYDGLKETNGPGRRYQAFSKDYTVIETKLDVLIVMEETRPLNGDSSQIGRELLQYWQKCRVYHQQENGYPDFALSSDREHFLKMFTNLLAAEQYKVGAPSTHK